MSLRRCLLTGAFVPATCFPSTLMANMAMPVLGTDSVSVFAPIGSGSVVELSKSLPRISVLQGSTLQNCLALASAGTIATKANANAEAEMSNEWRSKCLALKEIFIGFLLLRRHFVFQSAIDICLPLCSTDW